jgi:CBS domain-containing protein
LVIQDSGGALSGIFSERDLVRGGGRWPPALGRRLYEPPSHYVPRRRFARGSDGSDDQGRIRHVPVLDERHQLVGMISIGDVVKTRIAETVSEANCLRDYISAAI